MRYLYINKKNELVIYGRLTSSAVGEHITVVINDKTSVHGTIIDKRNGIRLVDWDVLNTDYLLKVLEDDL